MRTCKFNTSITVFVLQLIISASNGKTPQEQTAQILQVAPILPKSLAPPQQASATKAASAPAAPAPVPRPTAQAPPTTAAQAPAPTAPVGTNDATAPQVRRADSVTNDVDEFVDAKT